MDRTSLELEGVQTCFEVISQRLVWFVTAFRIEESINVGTGGVFGLDEYVFFAFSEWAKRPLTPFHYFPSRCNFDSLQSYR